MCRSILCAILFAGSCGWSQPAKETEGARELFYIAAAQKDVLPPIRKPAAAAPAAPAAAPPPAIAHLGLRYSIALVNPETNKTEPADAGQIFRKGQCLAIQFEANRSGYLYVLAQQSGGSWQPLLPSPEMPDESNVLHPGAKVRVPKGYCFEIADPPGTETLFVVLSRDPADIYDLHEGIRGRTPPAKPGGTLLASAKLVNQEVDRMSRAYKPAELLVRKVARPVTAGEAPNSVYVVNKSAQPATRVVTEIRIQHR